MSYDFKGDLENLNKRQIEFISDVLRKQNYKGTEVFVKNIGKKGDNYGSQVKRIKVQLENGEEFRVIVKILPDVMKTGDQKLTNFIFLNEANIFNEILPKFKEVQEKFGVPDEDLYKYPICYGTMDEKDNEIIILEDLDMSNFTLLDKTKPASNETVRLVLKNLAKFHSMSFVLRKKEPETLERFIGLLINPLFDPENKMQMTIFFENIAVSLRSMFTSSKYRNLIYNITEDFIEPWLKLNASDKNSKYSVIQHGDLWTNNIMFQTQKNQPTSCIFLDYQMCRYNAPVGDVHHYIFNCTDYETRSKHYYEWIDYYHSEMDRHLNHFNINVNQVYPKDKFDADLKRYGKQLMGISFFVLNITLRESGEAGDLVVSEDGEGTEVAQFKIGDLFDKTYDVIKQRIEGVIESCFQYGYINENLI